MQSFNLIGTPAPSVFKSQRSCLPSDRSSQSSNYKDEIKFSNSEKNLKYNINKKKLQFSKVVDSLEIPHSPNNSLSNSLINTNTSRVPEWLNKVNNWKSIEIKSVGSDQFNQHEISVNNNADHLGLGLCLNDSSGSETQTRKAKTKKQQTTISMGTDDESWEIFIDDEEENQANSTIRNSPNDDEETKTRECVDATFVQDTCESINRPNPNLSKDIIGDFTSICDDDENEEFIRIEVKLENNLIKSASLIQRWWRKKIGRHRIRCCSKQQEDLQRLLSDQKLRILEMNETLATRPPSTHRPHRAQKHMPFLSPIESASSPAKSGSQNGTPRIRQFQIQSSEDATILNRTRREARFYDNGNLVPTKAERSYGSDSTEYSLEALSDPLKSNLKHQNNNSKEQENTIMNAIFSDLDNLSSCAGANVCKDNAPCKIKSGWSETVEEINRMLSEAQTINTKIKLQNHRSGTEYSESAVNRKPSIDKNPPVSRPKTATRVRPPVNPASSRMRRPVTRDGSLPVLTPRQICKMTPTSMPDIEDYDEERLWHEQNSSTECSSEKQGLETWPVIDQGDGSYDNAPTFRVAPNNGFPDIEISSQTGHGPDQRRMLQLQNKVEELELSVQQLTEVNTDQLLEAQRVFATRQKAQQADYEASAERTYRLVDELIGEKKQLTEQCDKLVSDMRILKEKADAKLKNIEDSHAVEMKKVEGKILAAEKLRRERWEASKTKTIKEMTVKGVEREINRLVANHKEEMRALQQQCIEQVQMADRRAFESYGKKLEELRFTLSQEKEECCTRERHLANERLQKVLEEEHDTMEKMRKLHLKEMNEEKDRLRKEREDERQNAESKRVQMESKMDQMIAAHAKEITQTKEDMAAKHEADLESIEIRIRRDREEFEEQLRVTIGQQFSAREREMGERYRRERDAQLETAIRRLEEETTMAREEGDANAADKIRRLKDKHKQDIEDLERSERQVTERYNQLRSQCLQMEGENECWKVRLGQKEEDLKEVRAMYDKLNGEREHITEIVRQEFADRLMATDEESKRLCRELAETKSRLNTAVENGQSGIEQAKEKASAELNSLHSRIKEAIRKKDENFDEFQRQHELKLQAVKASLEASNHRCQHLEKLMERQRQQLLIQTTKQPNQRK